MKSNSKQISFINKLFEYNYIVHCKEVKEILQNNNPVPIRKGNLDIEIALDAYRFSDKYDTIILFSGDSDFAYLLDLLKDLGKKIVIISSKGHISKELLKRGKFLDLKKIRNYVEYIKSTKPLK